MGVEHIITSAIDEVKAKSNRVRSSAYPSYTLESTLNFVKKINDEFTSHSFTPPEAISASLELSGGAFLQRLSTAVQYDLLDLKKKEGYKPSIIFNKIIKPIPGENIDDFLLECLQKPDLYKRLFNDFKDKQLPSETGLVNILDRLYNVKGAGAKLAAKIFLTNVQKANLVSDNTLKISGYIPYLEITDNIQNYNNEPPATEEITLVQKIFNPIQDPVIEQEKINNLLGQSEKELSILLRGEDRNAKVILPKDFSDDDLMRIIKILNAYVS